MPTCLMSVQIHGEEVPTPYCFFVKTFAGEILTLDFEAIDAVDPKGGKHINGMVLVRIRW